MILEMLIENYFQNNNSS